MKTVIYPFLIFTSAITCIAQERRDSTLSDQTSQVGHTSLSKLNEFRASTDSVLAKLELGNRPALIYSVFNQWFLVFSPDEAGYRQYFVSISDGKIETLSSVSPDRWETSVKDALQRKAKEKKEYILSHPSDYEQINKYEDFLNRDSILNVAFDPSTYDRKKHKQDLALSDDSDNGLIHIDSMNEFAYFVMLDGTGNRYGEFCIPFIESISEIPYSGHRSIRNLVVLLFVEYLNMENNKRGNGI